MQINFPEVDWYSHEWTVPGQLKKLFEEAGEVAEAVAEDDPVNVIKEALDTMQTCATLINMVMAENCYVIDLEELYREHCEKLSRKGYLKE